MSNMEADVMERSEITSSMLAQKFRTEMDRESAEYTSVRTSGGMCQYATDHFCRIYDIVVVLF